MGDAVRRRQIRGAAGAVDVSHDALRAVGVGGEFVVHDLANRRAVEGIAADGVAEVELKHFQCFVRGVARDGDVHRGGGGPGSEGKRAAGGGVVRPGSGREIGTGVVNGHHARGGGGELEGEHRVLTAAVSFEEDIAHENKRISAARDRAVVVQKGHSGRLPTAYETRCWLAGNSREGDGEGFVRIVHGVAHEGNADGLRRLAGGEGEGPARRGVVCAREGRAVGGGVGDVNGRSVGAFQANGENRCACTAAFGNRKRGNGNSRNHAPH